MIEGRAGALNAIGLTRDNSHGYRWAEPGKPVVGPLPSVTTIIGVVDKSGPLVGWAKREVANAALRNIDMLERLRVESGAEAAARWLATIPGYQRDTAADIGSTVHELAEALSRGQEVSVAPDIVPYVSAYQAFLADFQPRFLALEEMVCSLRHGYGGTLDWIAEIGGEVWLGDNKTSKGIYQETALQLAAYAYADFIGRPGIPRRFRLPRPALYGVLHLRPEGYELIPYDVTADTFKAFLHAKALYDWREASKGVIGQAIGPALRQWPREKAS